MTTMRIQAYRTQKILPGENLLNVLDSSLPKLYEKNIVVITSKIVSMCQGRIVKNDLTVNKERLIRKEADYYIEEPAISRYHVTLTIKDGILIANSGIDESNGAGYFVLWPKDVFGEAKRIWKYLRSTYNLKHLGVMVVDSRITPMRWGTLGVGLAWCGVKPLKNYINEPDIFGRKLRMTKESIIDGLAGAANIVMGEGKEQTPIAVISEVNVAEFSSSPPTKTEIQSLRINPKDDIFSPLIHSPKWKRGGTKLDS